MKLPSVQLRPSTVALAGGLDVISSSMLARPGSASHDINYESVFGGGFERIGGIERLDGRPSPSAATYIASVPQTTYNSVAVGDTITGQTSGATGYVIYVSGAFIAMTKVVGTFTVGENMQVLGMTRGVHSSTEAVISATLDNTLNALAAAVYRTDIQKPTGSGPIRGVAVLGSDIYCWRDNAGATAMVMFKATTSGWTAVALGEYVSFSNANTSVGEGDTLTQGGTTATIARLVLESGTLASGTNTGKLIITGRSGNYAAGAATSTGGGSLTLGGAQVAITLAPGGRVLTDTYNFTASTNTRRLYGCDGVNPEFEFDGTIYVPLTTGMTSKSAIVKCHKNHLFFGFRGSLQHSSIMSPYSFSPVSGAAELGAGDNITGLISVSGSQDASAMLVYCQNSAWILNGNSSADWVFVPLSQEAGANPYSAEDAGVPMTHDTPGFRAYKTTQRFGNFTWGLDSRLVETMVRNKTPVASVFSKSLTRYRCFFSDGTAISGTPNKDGWEWTPINYGRTIVIAYSAEVSGATRTFYGDSDGWVYEADVGRSFDGDTINAYVRLHGLNQGQPLVDKHYRWVVIESLGESPFTLYAAAEFNDGDVTLDPTETLSALSYGGEALWDSSNWDESFWDTRRLDRKRLSLSGDGYNVVPIFYSSSAEELPYKIKTITWVYTPRKIAR